MNANQASKSPPAAKTEKSLPASAIEVTDKPGGSVTAYLDDDFTGDISNDECDEPEGTDGNENDDPILQEAHTIASSDVIELECHSWQWVVSHLSHLSRLHDRF